MFAFVVYIRFGFVSRPTMLNDGLGIMSRKMFFFVLSEIIDLNSFK